MAETQLRGVAISTDVFRSLDRGRAILESVDQLNQYLFTYYKMIASQWQHLLSKITGNLDGINKIIDYGCGQGLAALFLRQRFGSQALIGIRQVVAIEPSPVALNRACAIYHSLAPRATIRPVNKVFDAVSSDDLLVGSGPTLHIFSNVLDVDGYDHVALFRKALNAGEHIVAAVGHDRTAHGYSRGFARLQNAVESGAIRYGVQINNTQSEQFLCRNKGERAVMWLCNLEVRDG